MGAFVIETIAAYVGAAFMLLFGLFALFKGGQAERIGAGAYLLGWFASLILQSTAGMLNVQWGVFLIDIMLVLVFAALVWKSKRAWPVWACALQFLTVISHIMIILKLKTPISAFYTVLNMAGYGIVLAMAIGAFWAWQERKAIGAETDE
ncbi:hypothetical protein ABIE19_001065 [Brevundimonas faecalis]|uniref:Uncharacterized protein n=1 Tax=Brevundimonas faecalis TaxID=947378 RepID=A0ABV2R994_9CAUL